MECEKSLQRILTELKTSDKKVVQKIDRLDVIGVRRGNKFLASMDVEVFKTEAKSSIQQVEDLIERQFKLKKALIGLNASTKVNINGQEFTIAEAIEYKNKIIPLKTALLNKLRQLYRDASEQYQSANRNVESQLSKMIETSFENKEVKISADDIKTVTDAFNKANGVSYVDPIDVLGYIKRLDEEINQFTCEIDAVLSEANAVTLATV